MVIVGRDPRCIDPPTELSCYRPEVHDDRFANGFDSCATIPGYAAAGLGSGFSPPYGGNSGLGRHIIVSRSRASQGRPERRVGDWQLGRYPVLGSSGRRSRRVPGCGSVLAGFSTYKEGTMISDDSAGRTIVGISEPYPLAEAQMAAVAFLARYSGRTLDAYRHDLRNLFQWAADHGLAVLEATRAHLELYRASMEERGLAASTIDRRLSTACGFYRFAHIDGRISSQPGPVRPPPEVHPTERRGLDRAELGRFLFTAERFDHAHAALAVLLGLERAAGQRRRATPTSRTWPSSGGTGCCGSSARATSPRSSLWCRAPPAPSTWPSANAAKARSCAATTANASIGVPPPLGSLDRQAGRDRAGAPAHAPSGVHHGRPGCWRPLRDVQIAARHADPRTTTVYDNPRKFHQTRDYLVMSVSE